MYIVWYRVYMCAFVWVMLRVRVLCEMQWEGKSESVEFWWMWSVCECAMQPNNQRSAITVNTQGRWRLTNLGTGSSGLAEGRWPLAGAPWLPQKSLALRACVIEMLTELWPLAALCVTGIVFSVNTVTPQIGQTGKLLTTCFAFHYSVPVLWLLTGTNSAPMATPMLMSALSVNSCFSFQLKKSALLVKHYTHS